MTFLDELAKLAEGKTPEEAKAAQDKAIAEIQAKADAAIQEAGAVIGGEGATHTWNKGVLTKIEPSSTSTLTGDIRKINYDDPNEAAFAAWLEGQGKLQGWLDGTDPQSSVYWDLWEGRDPYAESSISSSSTIDTKVTPGDTEVITSTLRRWGFSADQVSGLAGWVQTQIQSGVPPESVLLLIMDQPQFKARFPGMQAAINAGYGPPSPDEYIMYEDSLRELVDKWLPGETVGNVDTLITTLMGGNISIQQVRDRLQIAYDEILNAPVDVKSWFMSEYGEAGDGMLASVLLDPNKDFTDLEQVAKEAYTQAASDQILGERITKGVAKNIANLGMTQEAQYRQFRDLSRQELLYAEKITEDTDLRIETEGVASAFGVDTGAMNTVEQRIEERGAAFGGGGGAVVGQRGATGFGSANA